MLFVLQHATLYKGDSVREVPLGQALETLTRSEVEGVVNGVHEGLALKQASEP